MAKHNDIGKTGEQLAVDYLIKKGYSIIERNWIHGKLEIDIIAIYKGQIVFIEVKTRTDDWFAEPKDAVNKKKIRNIVRAADAYIKINSIDLEPRFDIVDIVGDIGDMKIEHIEDAFVPPLF